MPNAMSSRQQHSRRSACERCRKYKLRCERNPRRGGICERCYKTSVTCVAAMPLGSSASRMNNGNSHKPSSELANPQGPGHSPCGGGAIPFPTRSLSCSAQPRLSQSPRSRWVEVGTYEEELGEQLILDSLLEPMSLNVDLGNTPLLDSPGTLLSGPKHQYGRIEQQQNFMFAEPHDTTNSGGSGVPSSSPEDDSSMASRPSNHLQDLFEICAQLAEDSTSPRHVNEDPAFEGIKSPVFMETVVERLLEKSARFCDVLENLMETEAPPTQFGLSKAHAYHQTVDYDPSSASGAFPASSVPVSATNTTPAPVPGPRCCLVLTTTLVTAYIMLVRNWRRVFHMIHDLLPASDAPLGSRCAMPSLMPSLQLGGFQVRSKPNTQVAILLELSSEIIFRIETGLGIKSSVSHDSPWESNSQEGRGNRSSERHTEAIIKEPMAVSIRETMLMQEQLYLRPQEGLEGLSLRDIMEKLRERLDLQARRPSACW